MTKYKQKKLRGKGYIQVDQQILNWRRRKRKAAKKALTSKANTPQDALQSPTIDDQPSPNPTTAYSMFEDV